MDQATRNSLQNATQQARRLLEREITEQLEGTFDVLPDGSIADKPGKHLDASQRLVRTKIVESIRHRAGGSVKSEDLATAVADYTREAAFTILNRYIALKMLEVRGLVQQCITKGDQSSGFKEFGLAAPGLAQLPDKGYRLFLESLFDELSTEVKILFDRHSDASFLWPRRQAFDGLLEILNADDLATVWEEDETIGWVYQYFNSDKDREKARYDEKGKSKAPQNCRDLAVRNQFFTPRYVVEFLTDNTLGRTWYEMRQGVTTLADKCRYLVCRPDEVFFSQQSVLADGELAGPRLFAKFLSEPECGSLLPFSADQPQAMIDLAHCVDGYVRHPIGREINGQWWPWHAKAQMQAGADLAEFKTQDLLDVMFAQCRADRHGDGEGIQEPLFPRIANEVRRRVLECRELTCKQGQLLKQPVFIPFRAKKDPRDLRILDPACGSSHFLIYCFDLLLAIYDEAWDDDQAPSSGMTGNTLKADYPTLEALHVAVPGLILRHNLHGIDIDARCAQIGAFALWMRAQRAYADFKIAKEERAPITRSNIVVAEPMPGEKDLLDDFLRTLKEDRLESLIREALHVPAEKNVRATKAMADSLCDLVRTIWDRMKLAGEAGSLLRIDKDLDDAICKGREEWEEKSPLFRVTEYGLGDLARTSLTREIPGEEADFWSKAEVLVLHALRSFARGVGATAAASFRRGLFADDAARGLAFIDICRVRMDVVLMNPPFGAFPRNADAWLDSTYSTCRGDLYPCFIQRWVSSSVVVGAITNRTGLFLKGLQSWRQQTLLGTSQLTLLGDLGIGVLDALVETAMYVIERSTKPQMIAIDLLGVPEPRLRDTLDLTCNDLRRGVSGAHTYLRPTHAFDVLPSSPIAYKTPPSVLRLFSHLPQMESEGLIFRVTSPNYDDFRYLRLRWEIAQDDIGQNRRWSPMVKGGEYEPYLGDVDLVADWDDTRKSFRGFLGSEHRPLAKPACADLFFSPGITWSERTASRYSPRVLPRGVMFSSVGPFAGGVSEEDLLWILGVLMSATFQSLLELFIAAGDETSSGSAARHYQVGALRALPRPPLQHREKREIRDHVAAICQILRKRMEWDETSTVFDPARYWDASLASVEALATSKVEQYVDGVFDILERSQEIERIVADAYGLDDAGRELVEGAFGKHPLSYDSTATGLDQATHALNAATDAIIREAVSSGNTGRFITVKSHYADRHLEVVCHRYRANAQDLRATFRTSAAARAVASSVPEDLLMYFLGRALGREFARSRQRRSEGDGDDLFELLVGHSERTLPAEATRVVAQRAPAFLIDDEASRFDVVRAIRHIWEAELGSRSHDLETQALGQLEVPSLREWLRSQAFETCISRYSRSRRIAPVYWQITTPSGAGAVWLCWESVSSDTLFCVLNEGLRPKLHHEAVELERARAEAGGSPTRTQRDRIEEVELRVSELQDLIQEMARLASVWAPNQSDGMLINAAPLWRLFPRHKTWQKECKQVWDSLVTGDYDWSHTAMHLWPERVVPRCVTDRSLAIAHGLENVFWEQDEDEKWVKRSPPEENGKAGWQPTIDRLVAERTSRQVKDAVASLLAAPVADGGKRGRRATAAESTTNGEPPSKNRKRKSKTRDE